MRWLKVFQRKLFAMAVVGMASLFFAGPVLSDTIVVDQNGGGNYRTIMGGINAAVGGDTVKVLAGIYEEAVSINKSITLVEEGPDTTTIRNPGGTAISVGVDVGVRISGFEIAGSRYGIFVGSRANVVIENNLIIGNGINGININGNDSSRVSVLNNTVVGNGGDGIYLDDSDPLLISNSIIVNNSE